MVYNGSKYRLRNIADKDIQKCFNVANIQQIMSIFGKKYWFTGTMLYWFDT